MERQLIKGMTMLLLVVALSFVSAVVSANGQSTSSARANIPFEFVVGSKTLPAGQYLVSPANAGGDIVKVASRDTNDTAFRLTINLNATPADKGKLVFRRYGNRYFLAEIWHAGERDGQGLMKSKEERAIERELASIHPRTQGNFERVEIALARK